MFKRGGLASYTKTGRRMQYGAAVGAAMARGGNNSTNDSSTNDCTNDSSSDSEARGRIGYILFIIFVYMLLNGMIESAKHKHG